MLSKKSSVSVEFTCGRRRGLSLSFTSWRHFSFPVDVIFLSKPGRLTWQHVWKRKIEECYVKREQGGWRLRNVVFFVWERCDVNGKWKEPLPLSLLEFSDSRSDQRVAFATRPSLYFDSLLPPLEWINLSLSRHSHLFLPLPIFLLKS